MQNIENNTEAAEPTNPAVSPKKQVDFRKYINYKYLAAVLVLLLLAGLAYYYKSVFVVATVDGQPISRLAVVRELERQSGREALDALISEKLINNEADKQNISVSQDELDAELKKVEDQIIQQGGTLDEALTTQGVSRADLMKQIELQNKAEKILGDKLKVSDEEVDKYITDSGQPLEAGREEAQKAEVREGLEQQKFSQEIATWLDEARSKASIKEFNNY